MFYRLPCQSYVAGPAHLQYGHDEECILGLCCQGDTHHRGSLAEDKAVRTWPGHKVSNTYHILMSVISYSIYTLNISYFISYQLQLQLCILFVF